MELRISQSSFNLNYEYTIFKQNEIIYYGKANRVLLPKFRKIQIFNYKNEHLLSVKQESFLRILLTHLPIISFFGFSVCPYVFYYGDSKIGYMEEEHNGSSIVKGEIYGAFYELIEHTGKYIAIYSDKHQIGLIEREISKIGDGDKYKLIFNNSFNKEIAICFCLLADILWHTSDTEIYSEKWEFSTELKERPLNCKWKPDEK
ncbi:hypothetical protein [uncultured Clostridium sp.]|uniref:hypothetical protein n=1 Tax=uncultured Clostridium sp. TaxID=59620 RepID=UPI0032162EE6